MGHLMQKNMETYEQWTWLATTVFIAVVSMSGWLWTNIFYSRLIREGGEIGLRMLTLTQVFNSENGQHYSKEKSHWTKIFVMYNSWVILICWIKSLNVLFKHRKNYRKLCFYTINELYWRYGNEQPNCFFTKWRISFFKILN